MNLVLMCGVDNTGKSTIAKIFAQIYNFSYFRNDSQHRNFKTNDFQYSSIIETAYCLSFLNQVDIAKSGIIFDRHLACEYAYGNAYSRPIQLDAIYELDKKFAELGAKIVYCEKDISETSFTDEIITYDKLECIKMYYSEYFNTVTSMPVLRLDTTDQNIQTQINTIFDFMKG